MDLIKLSATPAAAAQAARNEQLERRIELSRGSRALDKLGEENEREMETYEWVCGEVKWLQGEVEVEADKVVRKE